MLKATTASLSYQPIIVPKRQLRLQSWVVFCVGLVGCFLASPWRLLSDDSFSRNTSTVGGELSTNRDTYSENDNIKLKDIAVGGHEKKEEKVTITTHSAPTSTLTSTPTWTPTTAPLAKAQFQSFESIALHPKSPMASDIVSIQHNPAQSQILVNLHSNATCSNPYLVGRLSGPSLIMVDWHYPQNNPNVLVGTYQIPVAGTYHIELIEILCHNFLFAEKNQVLLNVDYHFSKECVQDVMQHRLTSDDAIITVPETSLNRSVKAYWKGLQDAFQHPTFTRVQPHDCRRPDESERCNGNLKWKQFYKLQYKAPIEQLQSTKTRICLIGDSHSRHMTASFNTYIEQYELSNNLQATHWPAVYPKEVTTVFIQKRFEVDNCTHVLVAVGQWPASYDQGRPMLLGEYHQNMMALFQRLQNALPSHVFIYARSIHSIPLRKRVSFCPPKDWRNPAVIYGYNLVIQQACQEYGIEYLDTNSVAMPMWDTSEDWNHLLTYVSVQEARVVLGEILKREEKFGAEQVVAQQNEQSEEDATRRKRS